MLTTKAHTARVADYFDRQSRTWPAQYESGLIADRCDRFIIDPPAGDWDGVWHANSK